MSAISGLYIGFNATGGWIARTGFLILSVLWLIANIKGYWHIRKKRFKAHADWMLKSYALTFAAVTLRIWLYILLGVFQLDFEITYQIIAWVSWVPNLLLAELTLLKTSKTHQF